MFDITAQTIHNEEEIYCLDSRVSEEFLTQLSLINDPVIISLQSTKVYVFSDSVLCLGKVLQHPECNEAWKNRVAGVRAERKYSDFEDVKGESREFEWNIFPGFTSLQLCDKIINLLSSLGQSPETFTGRILFMSMFNDISCDRKDNKAECLKNADFVKTFAKRFGIGNGLSLDQVLRKVVSFRKQPTRTMGSCCGGYATEICRKWTFHLPCNDTIVQRTVEKSRKRESVHALQC